MRIDAELSLADRARFRYPWIESGPEAVQRDFTAESIERILARNRFEGALLVADLGVPGETAWLLEQQRLHPDWVRGVIGSEPAPGVVALRGGVAALARAGDLPFDLVCEPGDLAQIPADAGQGIAVVVREPLDAWREALEALLEASRDREGVVVKIAGLSLPAEPSRPFVRWALDQFGPRRVLFGSGWPRCTVRSTWKESLAAFTQAMGARTMEDREWILGGNAARFYRLT